MKKSSARRLKKAYYSKKQMLVFVAIFALIGGYVIFHGYAASLTMNITSVATGFNQPDAIANTGIAGDNRLFILEQAGVIKIMHTDGTKNATPFLSLTSKVKSSGDSGEEGLLGMAFNPNYTSNGYFYVAYTDSTQALSVSRFSRSAGNPDIADATSEQVLLTVPHPTFNNHNGGDLQFGPDGYLYIGTGDGGSGGNPSNSAQLLTSLQGKMLRIDVNNGNPYAIPADNPYAGSSTNKKEIWAYGLRNPWRFSFDRTTHDLWIADVGQDTREEIDFQPAGTAGGLNYGWRCYEGNANYDLTGCGARSSYIFPIGEYDHGSNRCAVVGGYVYRGTQYPAMVGRFFFADFCTGHLYSLKPDGSGGWTQELLTQLEANPSAFGEDVSGEIYVADLWGGTIYHLTTTTQLGDTTPPTASITAPTAGATVSGTTTISATANDNIGVTKVEFLVDGSQKSTDTSFPYSYSWDTTTYANGAHSLTAKAYDAAGNIGTSAAVDITTSNAAPNPLPAPWQDTDIGNVGLAGSASFSNNTFTDKGAGADIGGTDDGLHFVYQSLNGDGQITARVAAVQNTNAAAKAGVMIRDSLNSNAIEFSLLAQPTTSGGMIFETRSATGGASTVTSAVPNIAPPYWLRLQRQGTSIEAFWSTDGANWNDITTGTISLGLNTYLGMAVSSHDMANLNTSTFDNVDFVSDGNSPPLIDITYPGHSGTFSGTLNVTTNVNDADGISKVEFYIDNVLKSTDTTSPYSYSWVTYAYANGTHTLQAKAYDTLNNASVHTHVVNIQNTCPSGDVNGDCHVTITDLSILLSNWGSTTNATCDLNHNGTVDIFDLSTLLSNYGN